MRVFFVPILLCCLVGAQNDVVDVMHSLGLRTMVRLLEVVNLTSTLQARESCTVFAPTDEAFSNLPADVKRQLREGRLLLLEVLMFHVSPNTTMSTSWENNYIVATLMEYLCSIRINIYPSTRAITADGSVISNPDNRASNGVVHVIDQVLYPQPIQSIAKEIGNIKQLKELSNVVEKAGFGRILNDAGPLTFFAPTDDAFQKLPNATLQNLLKNVTALTEVLSYHAVSGVYYRAGLSDGQELVTLQSGTLECHVRHTPGSGSQVEVNNAKILGLSVPALNGVMHVIDTVLFPPK